MTKSKKYTVLRIKYKQSKSYFTNHMGCNNNKIATLKILWLFLYSTNTYQFASYQHQGIWQ